METRRLFLRNLSAVFFPLVVPAKAIESILVRRNQIILPESELLTFTIKQRAAVLSMSTIGVGRWCDFPTFEAWEVWARGERAHRRAHYGVELIPCAYEMSGLNREKRNMLVTTKVLQPDCVA